MEKLFENTTTYNSKIYAEFVKFHNQKYNLKYNLYTLFMLILIAFCIVSQFLHGNIHLGILFVIIMFSFLIFRVFHPYFFVKKEANSNKVKKQLTNKYSFYDNYMEIKNLTGKVKIKYYKLYKIFETEDYFYLYINKNYSYVLSKSNFSIGTAEDFYKFMKKKLWYRI